MPLATVTPRYSEGSGEIPWNALEWQIGDRGNQQHFR